MKEKYPNDEDVVRLSQKFNPTKISETLPTSEFTAYSENKGEINETSPKKSLRSVFFKVGSENESRPSVVGTIIIITII